MKKHYGNYVGVVITGGEKDPEHRGRCQVFVPSIMPALYQHWNQKGEDISFEVIGEGLDGSLDPQIVGRLKEILPWAECVAPIIGASPSYKGSMGGFVSETLRNVGKFVGDITDRVLGGVKDLGFNSQKTPWSAAFISYAAANNDPSFPRNINHLEYSHAVRTGASSNWEALDPRSTQLRPGDIVVANRQDANGRLNNVTADSFKTGYKGNGASHGDVVVSVEGNNAVIVGGNVGNKVSSKQVSSSSAKSQFFTVLRPKNPEMATNIAKTASNELGIWQKNGWNEGSPEAKETLNAYWQSGSGKQPLPSITSQPNKTPSNDPHPSPLTSSFTPDPTNELELTKGYNEQLKIPPFTLEAGASTNLNTSGSLSDSFGGQSASYEVVTIKGAAGIRKDIPPDGRTAPIRFNNPGGAYPASKFEKFGMTSYGIIGGGHKIAQYPTPAHGIASNIYQYQNMPVVGMTVGQARDYWVNGKMPPGFKPFTKGIDNNQVITKELLQDPNFLSSWMRATAQDEGFGAISDQQMVEGLGILKQQSDFNPSTDFQYATQNPAQHQGVAGPNTNNQALGMFGYASEGQAVWVFFQEGNPLFPVYFGASYGSKEWGGIYQNASNATGSGTPGTEKTIFNLYGGQINSTLTTDESPMGAGFSFQLSDKNGSNLTFAKDHTQFNSMYNHVQRVLGDNHDIVEANKEVRVRGDYNTYAEQDIMVTVGNWSKEAIDASDEIQKIINEAMDIKASAGKS
jgi:hypothetical protein